MSDTPRTDSIVTGNCTPKVGEYEDLARFAHQLAIELSAAKKQSLEDEEQIKLYAARAIEAEKKVKELTEWRPMDTAPRNNTDIMLTNGRVAWPGYWDLSHWVVMDHNFSDSEFMGWLPLPNVLP